MADDDTVDLDTPATKRDLEELRGRLNDDMRALLDEFGERLKPSAGRNSEGSGRRISMKYRPLAEYLKALTYKTRNLTFSQIENIISGNLPQSAWDYPKVWWSNSWGPSQCSAWLSAGWRVATVGDETVRFERVVAELDGEPLVPRPGPR